MGILAEKKAHVDTLASTSYLEDMNYKQQGLLLNLLTHSRGGFACF